MDSDEKEQVDEALQQVRTLTVDVKEIYQAFKKIIEQQQREIILLKRVHEQELKDLQVQHQQQLQALSKPQ